MGDMAVGSQRREEPLRFLHPTPSPGPGGPEASSSPPHVSSLQEKATLSPEYSSVNLHQNEWSRWTHHNLTYSLNMQSLLPKLSEND